MPAVAGGWRKGMNRQGASYLRLSADVVGAHLVGDVFIGLYPLLAGNTCRCNPYFRTMISVGRLVPAYAVRAFLRPDGDIDVRRH